MSYRPAAEFAQLFQTFTGDPGSIGAELTRAMLDRCAGDPLLVSPASDMALFPGGSAPPQVESFRKSTRGFIEMTAVSHTPLAVACIARLRELRPDDAGWRPQLQRLIDSAERTRAANTLAMWRDEVNLTAFAGQEAKIVRMVEYTLATSVGYMRRALDDPDLLCFDALRERFLEAGPVPMNDVMFATFCLAYVDIAWRIGTWLRGAAIDWPRAMVLVSGQSGRPTAGVTWASNNLCHLIWRSAEGALPAERLYVAPFAPGLSVADMPDAQGMATLERAWRQLWCHTRASVELSREMFASAPSWQFTPSTARDMPRIEGVGDRTACVSRLRRIMEDPQQLLSNCVADYVVDALYGNGHRPEAVQIPGFTDVEYPG